MFSGLLPPQVLVAAFRKRNLNLPETIEELKLEGKEVAFDTEILAHTKSLR